LAAAKWWRRVLLAILMPLGAIAFYGISVKQNWLGQESVVLFTCICVSLYFSGLTAAASAPLTIHQRLGALYLVSNGSNIFRLAACYVLHQYDQLNAVSMAVLGTTITVVSALLYVKAAERHVINPRYSSSVIRQEIRRYVAPLVLATAFYAIQGQLSTFLIAWFGQAQGIAEVTALGRLGQIFNFLSALFAMLIIPNLARLSDAGFARRYPWAILGVLGISLILILTGFAAPQTLLWLLGYRYEHLLQEVSWSVLAGALGFAGGTIWCIHAARKWVFWAGTYFYITAITVVQSGFVLFVNMGSPLNVVLMGVAVNGVALLNQALVSWLGFKKVAKGCQPSPKSV
jgi:O-antigen/teichoic acid export membrane protein